MQGLLVLPDGKRISIGRDFRAIGRKAVARESSVAADRRGRDATEGYGAVLKLRRERERRLEC
jgi:hypothetical protein